MVYVTTKKELCEAVKKKESEIVVKGKLAKKLNGFVKLKKLSPKKKKALIAFATGSGAMAIGAIALAAPTGGLSVPGATVALVASAPAAGVSVGTACILIGLVGVLGLSAVALLKDYEVEAKVGDILHFKAQKSSHSKTDNIKK